MRARCCEQSPGIERPALALGCSRVPDGQRGSESAPPRIRYDLLRLGWPLAEISSRAISCHELHARPCSHLAPAMRLAFAGCPRVGRLPVGRSRLTEPLTPRLHHAPSKPSRQTFPPPRLRRRSTALRAMSRVISGFSIFGDSPLHLLHHATKRTNPGHTSLRETHGPQHGWPRKWS